MVIGPGALNVTLVLPDSAAPGLWAVDVAQRFVLERIAAALSTADRPGRVQGSGDLTIAGRKFGGSRPAQAEDWFLVHCSILYDFPLERIGRYLLLPSRQPAYRGGRSHEDFLRNLELPRRIVHCTRSVQPGRPPARSRRRRMFPTSSLKILLSERFASRSWIERL